MEGKSLEALTVSETAARAGIGKGTVYEYFPSKEAMTAAAVCYYMRQELTSLQGLIPLDQGFRIAVESSMTTVAEAVQSRLSFFHMVSGFSCFEMKRCLEGQEPAEEIRNVVQEQIRRILALGAEEGMISGASPRNTRPCAF
ncbi:TetR/AcrR family transcriptional regulator [[Clostridium] leptum]|uniref:TetR/AcrR family transcriptional regulator n=1 Tax=[Clostridium] leptum TaxID=1535 RepID=A0A412AY90_9FIRM|nr:TetR/AcrR family transcriptional regulator [[Clostridium] leptum]